MVHHYSSDLRSRVLSFLNENKNVKIASRLFSVGESTVIRWRRLYKATGQISAKPFGSKRIPKLEAHKSWLLQRVKEDKTITLLELKTELFETKQLKVAQSTLWEFFERHHISFKKNSVRNRTRPR